MSKKPGDKLILISSKKRMNKESLVEKLIEITCTYGRTKAREEYVKIKKLSQEEQKRGFWRNDDYIFLDGDIERECARLCSGWADDLEKIVNELIQDLAEEDDEEK